MLQKLKSISIFVFIFLILCSMVSIFNFGLRKTDNPVSYELYSSSVVHKTTIYDEYYNQSIVIYNDVIYTFYCSTDNRGYVEARNLRTGEIYNSMEIDVGHANGAFLSSLWRDETDDTPLIFVAHCTLDNKISSVYFVDNVAYVHKVYTFNSAYSGLLASLVIDNENQIAYTIGTAKGYHGYGEGANSVIGVYDLTKEVQLEDGTYTFENLDTFEIPEIVGKQDVDFYDGLIWILTFNADTEFTEAVYGINPKTQNIEVKIDEFLNDKITYMHGEGLAFYKGRLYLNSYLGYTVRYKYYE